MGARKYPSLLEDFHTGTASMARKRHLASNARGFSGFCFTPCRTRSVKFVKSVVEIKIASALVPGGHYSE